jgi:hypothetical protein
MHSMNAAQKILARLGAYAAPRGLAPITQREIDSRKRRTRPLIGRGDYGKNLRAHFDTERNKAAYAKGRRTHYTETTK